jgi:hypothetical protein
MIELEECPYPQFSAECACLSCYAHFQGINLFLLRDAGVVESWYTDEGHVRWRARVPEREFLAACALQRMRINPRVDA